MLDDFIERALAEDVGDGDHTSMATIPANTTSRARLIIKEDGVLAGVDIAKRIFFKVDPTLKLDCVIEDGTTVKNKDVVLTVAGHVHSILKAERLVLNIMQRMSGIATATAQVVNKLKSTNTKVLDTRKTTPGIRFLEKEAVRIGGGVNHRFGLYDMILIKDNHVDYAGGVKNAIVNAKKYLKQINKNLPIEIEVRNLNELDEVLAYDGFERIMFDNFDPDTLKKAVQKVANRFKTEASGGITIDNVLQYALCGVDYISMGTLTHSVKSLDMSLKAF